ncbi:MAG TPA: FAA hydrolase family protein [Desulfotomaculum sp.]|nr:MAG: fumarylacetoacetate hydrolase [Desulfotomaculum sp. BICA1-6]HBX23962.1 FAA hydrolase family protein [Desulfotomaculum sp.]
MRLATIWQDNVETAAVLVDDKLFPVSLINYQWGKNYPVNIFDIIASGQLEKMNHWYRREGRVQLQDLGTQAIPLVEARLGPLFRQPRKIWGIGLNYADHAADLAEKSPETEPASFMKPDTTIIGPGESIKIPLQSARTTAEGELGVVIGKICRNVEEYDAPEYIAGFTTIIDMTAEDILRKNPRYLTRSKSFDTFFSFGPVLVTPEEIGDLLSLKVSTVLNGQVHRQNVIANMTFPPYFLISFHSKVMTLLPGDIISTGTPGAALIKHGDVVECVIDGFEALVNPVEDCKWNV